MMIRLNLINYLFTYLLKSDHQHPYEIEKREVRLSEKWVRFSAK